MTTRGTIVEPQREINVFRECDVVVVGGGPAGWAAAVAAGRAGADTILVERYGHLGGMATGGLVIQLETLTDGTDFQPIRGVAQEISDRLQARDPSTVMVPPRELFGSRDPKLVDYWRRRHAVRQGTIRNNFTVEPEHLKFLCNEMVEEAHVKLLLHSWGTQAIVEGNRVIGIVFESKSGRQAILAKVVVDGSGDGDMFATAGAEFTTELLPDDIHSTLSTDWRFGGVDMDRFERFMTEQPDQFAELMRRAVVAGGVTRPSRTARDDVAWFNPRVRSFKQTDVEELTWVEMDMRKKMIATWEFYRKNVPGFENCWILDTASQIGTRGSRMLKGAHSLTEGEWKAQQQFADAIGMTPSPTHNVSAETPNIVIPYGTLVPEKMDGLLASGRCISVDPMMHTMLRLISQAMVTGQAAGVAGAVAAKSGVQPRHVNIQEVQNILLEQDVVLPDYVARAIRGVVPPAR